MATALAVAILIGVTVGVLTAFRSIRCSTTWHLREPGCHLDTAVLPALIAIFVFAVTLRILPVAV